MPRPVAPTHAHAALATGIMLLATACATVASEPGRPGGYALDPVHTRVLVAVTHAGFSKALGTVSGSEGWLLFDPADWSSARLDVRIPLSRLDFGDADWNRAVAARSLLDSERHPEARFVSTVVTALDPNHATVCGTLTVRGVTRPQCLDVALNAMGRHPLPPFRQTAGFSATATLSRADYGIKAWPSMIGDAVELRIEAEAVRDGEAFRALRPAAPAPTAAPGADATPDADAPYPSMEAAAEAAAAQASDCEPAMDPERVDENADPDPPTATPTPAEDTPTP